ncbi:MAG: GTPase [Hydrogeniiclostridium mannosilyticum]
MAGRAIRIMVVGIPNVGKSSLINKLTRGGKAEVEDRPALPARTAGFGSEKEWIFWTHPGFCGPSLKTLLPANAWRLQVRSATTFSMSSGLP